jgi:peptide/nickel transport system ATP-binding protein
MSERTERSEGHERMLKVGSRMSERTERSEGHERMPKAGTA